MGILKKDKIKYYSLKKILAKDCLYSIAIGKRSNGKTYAGLKYGLEQWWKTGKQLAYIRRYREDIYTNSMTKLYAGLVSNGEVEKITGGAWTGVLYKSKAFYLTKTEGEETVINPVPFAFCFALSTSEHDKSVSYPDVGYIILDEMLSRTGYLPNEFILFSNLLSTIIRNRGDVKIFMFGNTVSKYDCPYFTEMGLKHIKEMTPNTIDVYTYGDSALTVAVEFTDPETGGSEQNKYFAFDNPRLKMITGDGSGWEIDLYPHCPVHYSPKDVMFTYFIENQGDVMQCEVISVEGNFFTFIHRKTTPYKPGNNLIYTMDYVPDPWHRRTLAHPVGDIDSKLYSFFRSGKVFYADNEVGEFVRSFLML